LKPANETVVLIHGFAAHWVVMAPIAAYLKTYRYKTRFWTFRSTSRSISDISNDFASFLRTIDEETARFHLVAHSMGSIVSRLAVQQTPLKNLGRMVFLAPPNRGLPAARLAPAWLRRACPAVDDLSDDQTSFVNRLSTHETDQIGIIAANCDVLVPIASTHIENENDHATVLGSHNSLLVDPRVFRMVLRFIKTGTLRDTRNG
jgi:pimeloyl-ACP methyl ester carboxylesterase